MNLCLAKECSGRRSSQFHDAEIEVIDLTRPDESEIERSEKTQRRGGGEFFPLLFHQASLCSRKTFGNR
jgi:hypothetical protein